VFLNIQLAIVAITITGVIIAYGILKHKLFDIELIVKKTFIYTVVALTLIGLFRLIELGISYTVSTTFFGGDLMARFIAAAIVATIFFPFRSLAMRIGDKLFPSLTETIKFEAKREIEIYRRQLGHVLEDGVITEKEEKGLRSLREDLGIPIEVHEELLEELKRSRKVG
jgi:hypothetical protein